MKILITGAAGMLAEEVVSNLLKHGHKVVQADINQRLPDILKINIQDRDGVMRLVEKESPDYIFHLAAETDVDLCEEDPDHAFRVNSQGTENIALVCLEHKIPCLYISTGAVFSGVKQEPYTEFDTPLPVSVYGRSKLKGEEIVKNTLNKYFIIRAGWMVGGWELDKKFVYKIVQQLKKGQKQLRVVADKFGSPTFTKDFANNLMSVINSKRYGLYHMANTGTCSRYDMAVKIVEYMGLNGQVTIEPVSSEQFPLSAPRARSEMMQNHKLQLLGLNNMPRWEDSLKNYIKENKCR
ncbi:MAG: dTDP-4-dehydrorhamnose reductase [Candidatus Omnitrophica bacterium]|nr:dTDP-4-dehydrorhamnose reductase [Candidatus Omnitrophota bacterium]